MDVVDLPILGAYETPRKALETMRARSRSGIVVRYEPGGAPRTLVKCAAVIAGISRGVNSLEGLETRHELFLPTLQQLGTRGVDVARPHENERALESMLDAAGMRSYGILAAGRDVALVFTRHEGLAERLNTGPADCYCTGCEEPAGGPPPAGDCIYCKRHGTITCAQY